MHICHAHVQFAHQTLLQVVQRQDTRNRIDYCFDDDCDNDNILPQVKLLI